VTVTGVGLNSGTKTITKIAQQNMKLNKDKAVA